MPFTKHIIEPNNISQCPLPPGEPNELECLSNLTLANVIRQLSSLGQQAGRIFDELSHDVVAINKRSQILNKRIENLKTKCSQLDIQNEEVSLNDFQTKKQFKSLIKIDQQVVSRKTMPEAIRLMYESADPPPALDKLNPYRTDGKDCMKFYTDPEFFFNIWCNELIKDNETRKIEKKKRRTKGGEKQLQNQQQNLNTVKQPLATLNPNSGQFIDPNVHLQFDDPYQQQQHILLMNQAKLHQKHQQLGLIPGNNGSLLNKYSQLASLQLQQQQQLQKQAFSDQINNDQPLPPPPSLLLQQQQLPPPPPLISQPHNQQLNNYQIYAESTTLNNGHAKINKLTIQQQQQANVLQMKTNLNGSNISNNNGDRPVFPPPPIPDQNNQISDLQQIQQQLIRKYDIGNGSNNHRIPSMDLSNNHHGDIGNDLPPPPSPPNFTNDVNSSNKPNGPLRNSTNINSANITAITMATQAINSLTITNTKNNDLTDSMFDMPLPPPPLELQDNISHHNHLNSNTVQNNLNNCHNNNGNHAPLPPPPPLPPLVESDTASSSTSSLAGSGTNNLNGNQNNISTSSKSANAADDSKSGRSFLDDISKRRYVLKPTQPNNGDSNSIGNKSKTNSVSEEANGRDSLQPFVNNSDVAAIIDFIRKFRPHVCDSSDDEENSDWDE